MNELALFAGAGGGLLASQYLKKWRTVCYVEKSEYAGKVIKARIRDGILNDAPIWDDAKTFDGRPWYGCVDIISAGFPCQPWSNAGKRRGEQDNRNLWPDTVRIINEVKPKFILLENVPGLLSASHGYFGQILKALAESGYNARWRVLSAAEVGAPHKRDRVWVMAYTNSLRCIPGESLTGAFAGAHSKAAVTGQWGSRYIRTIRGRIRLVPNGQFFGMDDGLAHRMDRIRAIGEGQVPAVAGGVWGLLLGDV